MTVSWSDELDLMHDDHDDVWGTTVTLERPGAKNYATDGSWKPSYVGGATYQITAVPRAIRYMPDPREPSRTVERRQITVRSKDLNDGATPTPNRIWPRIGWSVRVTEANGSVWQGYIVRDLEQDAARTYYTITADRQPHGGGVDGIDGGAS